MPFLNKEPQTISLSTNHVELNVFSSSEDIIVTCDGTVSAESTDPSIATCSVSGNTVTINGAGTGFCDILIVANPTQTKMSASAIITVDSNADIASDTAPSFNANNFAPLDTTATRQYYFGQYGNAFYGVSDGSVTAVSGTGQASGEVPYWELVDTDGNINNTSISVMAGSLVLNGPYSEDIYDPSTIYYTTLNGSTAQALLDNTNNLKNTYFNAADHAAMKHAGSNILMNDVNSSLNIGSLSSSDAYIWPLSYTQYNSNSNIRMYDIYTRSGASAGSIPGRINVYSSGYLYYGPQIYYYRNYNGGTWSSTQCCSVYEDIGGSRLYANNISLRIAPAFNLDLAKVLIPKPALSDTTSTNPTDISVKVSEDNKFLINAGSAKSDFTINLAGEYSVTEITSVNSGTNYISYIIYDLSGIAICYGNLSTLTQTSGTIDFKEDIFDNLESLSFEPGPYTLAIFQEEKCDSYKTDYASEPCYFRFLIN